MRVSSISSNNSSNFGMALHMNEKKIERKLGKVVAEHARKARPELEQLAKDCEIYVKPVKYKKIPLNNHCLIEITKSKFLFPSLYESLGCYVERGLVSTTEIEHTAKYQPYKNIFVSETKYKKNHLNNVIYNFISQYGRSFGFWF